MSKKPRHKIYRNWNKIFNLGKKNPHLACTLATINLTTDFGDRILKNFPVYFREKRVLNKKVPLAFIIAYAREYKYLDTITKSEKEVLHHLITYKALDHFDIPYVTLSNDQGKIFSNIFASISPLTPFTQIFYHGEWHYVIEAIEDIVYLAKATYFDNIPSPHVMLESPLIIE